MARETSWNELGQVLMRTAAAVGRVLQEKELVLMQKLGSLAGVGARVVVGWRMSNKRLVQHLVHLLPCLALLLLASQ